MGCEANGFIGAIDQGTTSSRFIIFDHDGTVVSSCQREHRQFYPRPGWVEHDPMEIWHQTEECIRGALREGKIAPRALTAIGVTNQRETIVVWNPKTGEPWYRAIVWQDTRTDEICRTLSAEGGQYRFYAKTGLPIATYFSGPKVKWVLDQNPDIKRRAARGEAVMGTIDTWLIWQLTGGTKGGVHVTDVSNASRTMLMNLAASQWDEEILRMLDIPRELLPVIRPSSDPQIYGYTAADGPLGHAIPVSGDLGDQQAALFGQACFHAGEGKNTYGTGCFLLLNTGEMIVPSHHGLITTVAYQVGNEPVTYALEGSVAMAGSLVQWVRDNLKLVREAKEVSDLAATVPNSGGVFFVPAFTGLFAPYWRSDARGVIVGLTHYVTNAHLARAVLEATAYQTRDICEAMNKDSGIPLTTLKVDGGMVVSEPLMQFQADMLGIPVIRPKETQMTAVGAAFAAGLAVGFWNNKAELKEYWQAYRRWEPTMTADNRERLYEGWKKAVERSFNWVEEG